MGYTKISNEIIELKEISDGAFRLYILLQKMCYGEKKSCFPSQGYLANALNKSSKTIQRYLEELIGLGLVKSTRRGSSSNLYVVVDKVSEEVEQDVLETKDTQEVPQDATYNENYRDELEFETMATADDNKEERTKNIYRGKAKENKQSPKNYDKSPDQQWLQWQRKMSTEIAGDKLGHRNESKSYRTSSYRSKYNPFKSSVPSSHRSKYNPFKSPAPSENNSRKASEKKKTFNSYDQRNYDLNYLEALLLGYEQYDENKLYIKEE